MYEDWGKEGTKPRGQCQPKKRCLDKYLKFLMGFPAELYYGSKDELELDQHLEKLKSNF